MVGADGMRDTNDWLDLSQRDKVAWLAQLDDVQVRAQASVVAASECRTVRQILTAWVALDILPAERLGPVLVAAVAPR
jgi:hypothetical protein